MATPRALTITPEFQRDFVAGVQDAFRIRLTASAGVGLPNEVFAYRALPLQPGETDVVGFFSHVCSPVDLEEFPVGAPRVNTTPPWFRLASVDLVFRSRHEADRVYQTVLDEVNSLIASLAANEKLVALEAVRLGDPGASSSSSLGS